MIKVRCGACGEELCEDDVELKDIWEGDRGQDIVCFDCPECGEETSSERRGRIHEYEKKRNA